MFLPERCWDNTGTRLLFHNAWGSLVKVIQVDTSTGSVSDVSGEDRKGAWLVLDVSSDLVVAQFAALNTSPQLVRGYHMHKLSLYLLDISVHWNCSQGKFKVH